MDFNIINWNCNGLNSHFDELAHFVANAKIKPTIICLQETHATSNILPALTGYSYTHNFRKDRKGGGTAIYIINDVYYNILNIDSLVSSEIEITGIEVPLKNNNVTLDVYSIYIAPNIKFNSENLKQLLKNKNHVILGDLNAKNSLWGSPFSDFRGKIIANFLEDNDLVCLNTGEGTRINNNASVSHLDLSICNSSLSSKVAWEVLANSWGSDHYPTTIRFVSNLSNIGPALNVANCKNWNLNKADWIGFTENIKSNLPLLTNQDEINDNYLSLTKLILNAADSSIPLKN